MTGPGRRRSDSTGAAGTSSACLAIFSKPARAGRVKTRLTTELTAEQAARLHAAFLGDLIEEMLRGQFDLRVVWALEPGDSLPTLSVPSMVQSGADLGERLYRGLEDLANDYSLVAAVGSDHPNLPVSLVQEAFDKLDAGAEVVLGPAEDGGYYLVAVRKGALTEEIFGHIPWSSSEVLQTTLDRCRELDLNVNLLPTLPDVDTPEDLARLIADLERDPTMKCPRTRTLLRSWQRLPRSVREEEP